MKKTSVFLIAVAGALGCWAQPSAKIAGPDGNLEVCVSLDGGKAFYEVLYKGKTALEPSPLGVMTSQTNLSDSLSFDGMVSSQAIDEHYTLDRAKCSSVNYKANEGVFRYKNSQGFELDVVFRVSNNDVAFTYRLPKKTERFCTINKENTGFDFPKSTTTFITPQALPMTGWMKTKPSYEEEYTIEEPVGTPSTIGVGYTFPALFHVDNALWVLVSETGVDSRYVGTRLGEGSSEGLYMIEFPQPGENNGLSTNAVGFGLPGQTSWRTITVGDNLAPIVESTVAFDVVEPLYEPSQTYKPGRGTWSWILWQDNSVNYDDQVKFIDLAAAMNFEYVLVDGLWDVQIGYDRIPSLVKYAKSKGVDIWLWYNSNGYANDAPQGPHNRMNTIYARQKEMKWMKEMGVKGIKVDFFAGDKQETMKLYEDILTDANNYGLMVDFHGTTIPRGWQRMFPNYCTSEAVLASENLIFSQHHADKQVLNSTILPFTRNAIGSMEFGPVFLNKRFSKDNQSGNIRRSTDAYELATSVLYFSPIQFFGLAPNNLSEQPAFVLDFLRNVPTVWDETRFIDGYPGKYCIMARRSGDKWYICATNAQKQPLDAEIAFEPFAGKSITLISDKADRSTVQTTVKADKHGKLKIKVQPNGGAVMQF